MTTNNSSSRVAVRSALKAAQIMLHGGAGATNTKVAIIASHVWQAVAYLVAAGDFDRDAALRTVGSLFDVFADEQEKLLAEAAEVSDAE